MSRWIMWNHPTSLLKLYSGLRLLSIAKWVWLNEYPPNQNSMPIARDAFTLSKPRGQLVSPWCLLVQHREARRTTKLDVLLLTFRDDTIYDFTTYIHQLTNLQKPHLNPICQIGFPGPMFTRRDHTQFFFRCGEVRPGTLKGQQRHIFLSGHCISLWGAKLEIPKLQTDKLLFRGPSQDPASTSLCPPASSSSDGSFSPIAPSDSDAISTNQWCMLHTG